MALQEPVPGQPLTATWGRDVVRELRSLRPLGGPGMRVTRGPNGVTIASVRKGGGDMAERIGQYPFRLGFRDVLVSGSTHKYAVIYVNDGAVQKDGDADVDVAAVANNAATGMETGWYDVAEYFNDVTGEQVTNPMTTVLPSEGQKDVYALVYTDYTGSFSVAIQMTPVWTTYSGIATKIDRYYLGTITRTDTTVGEETVPVFTISNQALRSGVVAVDADKAESLPKPWQLKVEEGATGNPLLCYLPSVYLDGIAAVVDNSAYGATGSGWYQVPYTRDADNWTQINAFIDIEHSPPHVLVAATGPTAPNGYLAGSMMPVGKIATETGASGEELTPEVKAQYAIGDTYRAQDEFRPYKPFEIMSVFDEDANSSIPIVFQPLVYVDGELATIDNDVYDGDWYEIEAPTALSDVASVTAYIKRGTDGNHVKVSTETTATNGYTDGKIDIGEFLSVNGVWIVSGQYQVGVCREPQTRPFDCRIINGAWKIYLPYGCVQFCTPYTGGGAVITPRLNRMSGTYWYSLWSNPVANTELHCEAWTNGTFDIVTSYDKTAGHPVARVGVFRNDDGTLVFDPYVRDNLLFSEYDGPTGGGGGGGGTLVTVESDTGDASDNFVTWTSGSGPTGTVSFKQHPKIAASKVALSDEDKTDVDAYLKGGATGFGTNINTENFEDECLAPTGVTGEPFVGESNLAAREDHQHLITEDVMALKDMVPEDEPEKEDNYPVFGSSENYTTFMRWLGVMTSGGGGATGETGEVPEDEQIVTFGDITDGVNATMGASGIGSDTDTTSIVPAPQDNMLDESDLEASGIWQGSWDRDTDTEGKGCSFYIQCGMKTINQLPYKVYRKITIDKYGMIRKISRAKFAVYDNLLG